ncbi:hypothetical protein [Rhizobium leguminosarum]|jgi:hypothetical protein|uniref:hypothetical protein n=1 Tax=Rhizobium leguminosarum TaxID=384 RepID=UPI001615C4C9|nr:hypothetical protein [Rhizobium leguminosarum]MBB4342159.1 hypothetical protein [Rhizobium leguminosarum]MBB6294783.1 hypothetical protein [Rhizobium leguminosarum]
MFKLGLVEKLVVGAVGLMIVIGLYVGWSQYQQSKGAADERVKQEKANAEFRVRVNKGVVDYDTCDRAGGLFNFRKATCELP